MPTVYVDAINGDNSNSGSELSPKKTIASAYATATSTGTVYAYPAIYRETIPNNIRLIGLGQCVVDGERTREVFTWGGGVVTTTVPSSTSLIYYIKNFTFRNPLNNYFFGSLLVTGPDSNTDLSTLYVKTPTATGGANSGYTWTTPGTGNPTWQTSLTYIFGEPRVTLISCNFYYDSPVTDSCLFLFNPIIGGINMLRWKATNQDEYSNRINTATTVTYTAGYYAGRPAYIKFDKCTVKNVNRVVNVAFAPWTGHAFYTYSQVGSGVPVATSVSTTPTPNIVLNFPTSLITGYDSIVDLSDTTNPKIKAISFPAKFSLTGTAMTLTNVFGPGATFPLNITTTPPTYRNTTFGGSALDLSLAANVGNNNTYIRGGRNGSNIGGWYPEWGFNTIDPEGGPSSATTNHLDKAGDLPVFDGTGWITDPNYPDTPTPQAKVPALRVVDATIYSGVPHFEINTNAYPLGTSAAVLSPVWKISVRQGITAQINKIIAEVAQDTAPSSGSKHVVDSTVSDATRTARFRASIAPFTQTAVAGVGGVPSWADLAFIGDSATTFQQTFFIQLQFILTKQGA
jgi:hypothetical protein